VYDELAGDKDDAQIPSSTRRSKWAGCRSQRRSSSRLRNREIVRTDQFCGSTPRFPERSKSLRSISYSTFHFTVRERYSRTSTQSIGSRSGDTPHSRLRRHRRQNDATESLLAAQAGHRPSSEDGDRDAGEEARRVFRGSVYASMTSFHVTAGSVSRLRLSVYVARARRCMLQSPRQNPRNRS